MSSSSNNIDTFSILISYKGKTITIDNVSNNVITNYELYKRILNAITMLLSKEEEEDGDIKLKILLKGKRLDYENEQNKKVVFYTGNKPPKKSPKIIVMASSNAIVQDLNSKRSDPLIRGFEQEKEIEVKRKKAAAIAKNGNGSLDWGDQFVQHKDYKFCRFEACTWQSFGHRTGSTTPHAFEALQLLYKLANDPGIVAVMIERELVVNTLGEMDPIDDRIMQNKQQSEGGLLLGYNTNRGLRIDIKLRSDDLNNFRPYQELVSTLIHELSHNWVSDHNLLFWTNYAQMMIEYIYTHITLRSTCIIINGKTTTEIAQLNLPSSSNNNNNNLKEIVFTFIMKHLQQEMIQHSLHPNMIIEPIQQRCNELEKHRLLLYNNNNNGKILGGKGSTTTSSSSNAREMAFAAAEQRRRQQQREQQQQQQRQQNNNGNNPK